MMKEKTKIKKDDQYYYYLYRLNSFSPVENVLQNILNSDEERYRFLISEKDEYINFCANGLPEVIKVKINNSLHEVVKISEGIHKSLKAIQDFGIGTMYVDQTEFKEPVLKDHFDKWIRKLEVTITHKKEKSNTDKTLKSLSGARRKENKILSYKIASVILTKNAKNVRQRLIDGSFIDDRIGLTKFKKIFSGSENVDAQINWIGSQNSLCYFIKGLPQPPDKLKTVTAQKCFQYKGEDLNNDFLSSNKAGKTSYSDKTNLDAIINFFSTAK